MERVRNTFNCINAPPWLFKTPRANDIKMKITFHFALYKFTCFICGKVPNCGYSPEIHVCNYSVVFLQPFVMI